MAKWSERLREWRTARGYSITHAAAKLRVTKTRLEQLESGHTPTPEELHQLTHFRFEK